MLSTAALIPSSRSALIATRTTWICSSGTAADQLIIPDYFLNRERHILLRFESDDAIDLFLLNRRQLHKSRENRLARDGVIDGPPLIPSSSIISRMGARFARAESVTAGFAQQVPAASNRLGPVRRLAGENLPAEIAATKVKS